MIRHVSPSVAAAAVPSTSEGRPWDADTAAKHESKDASTQVDE